MVISLQFADINIDLCKLITIINDGNHDKRGGGGDGLQIQASWRVVETYTQAAHTHTHTKALVIVLVSVYIDIM